MYTLTNYIERTTGILRHGSELSHTERFKTDNHEKIQSYQCNQNMPYAREKVIIDGIEYWDIARKLYGQEKHLTYVRCK